MESREKESMPAWMDDVQVYIQEHYTDQGLSVSGIADEYGFTVSHLSRTFKSVIGIGLLEYIQKLRVDKAKELLEEGASVNDAAVGSGYLDAKALTRAFKKYVGTTPGSYRDSKKQ
jgi:AraC-like DNA-binding protein